MMTLQNQKQRNAVYLAARAGFRAMPLPIRTALLSALNSTRVQLRLLRRTAAASLGKYRCPVCHKRVGRFDPLPAMYVEESQRYGYKYGVEESETCNAEAYLCPWCEASDRERLYALYLRDYFRELASAGDVSRIFKIVDFAPTLQLTNFIKSLIADSPASFSYRTADLLMEGVDDTVDIMDLKIYADESVDFFICSHVLEHVPDDKRALRELNRILRRDGRGILVVPIALTADEIDEDPSITDPGERWRRFGQSDHVRQYSKGGFLSRVMEAGFEVHQLGSGHFGQVTFKKHGITDQSVLYVVEKA